MNKNKPDYDDKQSDRLEIKIHILYGLAVGLFTLVIAVLSSFK